jgi:cobalt-precorrin-5B (C1)-methyltransferase
VSITAETRARESWRTGFTTGTCAAAAAKAATVALCFGRTLAEVEVGLPNGERVRLPVLHVLHAAGMAEAAVRKDAGDDPDVTHHLVVRVAVTPTDGAEVVFRAGQGVGTATLPGLAVPPGEPAINPAPRRQITAAVREVTDRGLVIAVSIPGGEEIAARTFNPRLGVVGGLSILGTDGRVRPFSNERLLAALVLGVDVARANGVTDPVLVPGHIGRRNALASLGCAETQVVDVSNEVGAMLDRCIEREMRSVLLFGHPGKLAKLALGEFDTHSSRSRSALEAVLPIGKRLGLTIAETMPTTEALFTSLSAPERQNLGNAAAQAIRDVTAKHYAPLGIAVWLTDLAGNRLGTAGDLAPWFRKSIDV